MYVGLAVLPAMLLLVWLYTRNTLQPEPKRQVYRLFLLGAAIVFPAGLVERFMLETTFTARTGLAATVVTAFFVAGMVEEFLKAAIVDRAAFRRGLMKRPIDCIVYCGAVALGFATVENILYVTSSGFATAILRSVTAIPAHLMFGIVMGTAFVRAIWFGANQAWAYVLPALVHGMYDAFALSASWIADLVLIAYLIGLMEWSLRQLDWVGSLGSPRRTAPMAPA
ncbi:MAG: PrsW family intramembrane metalloprotease [Alicyclobacillus sp.]|nr:PrsW family intramembrane metalloprotease [Alicyclobacillus sp.]